MNIFNVTADLTKKQWQGGSRRFKVHTVNLFQVSVSEIAKRSKMVIPLAVAAVVVVPWMTAVLLLLLRLLKVCQEGFLAWKNDLF